MKADYILERIFGAFVVVNVIFVVVDGYWRHQWNEAAVDALLAIVFILLENQCRRRREDFRDNGERAL